MTSTPYTVTAARSVSGVSVDFSPPTSTAGGLTTYGVSFEHLVDRATLDSTAGSTVTIALPANTGLGSFDNGARARSTSGPPGRLLRSHRHQ